MLKTTYSDYNLLFVQVNTYRRIVKNKKLFFHEVLIIHVIFGFYASFGIQYLYLLRMIITLVKDEVTMMTSSAIEDSSLIPRYTNLLSTVSLA